MLTRSSSPCGRSSRSDPPACATAEEVAHGEERVPRGVDVGAGVGRQQFAATAPAPGNGKLPSLPGLGVKPVLTPMYQVSMEHQLAAPTSSCIVLAYAMISPRHSPLPTQVATHQNSLQQSSELFGGRRPR